MKYRRKRKIPRHWQEQGGYTNKRRKFWTRTFYNPRTKKVHNIYLSKN